MKIKLTKRILGLCCLSFFAFNFLHAQMEVTDAATAPYTPENLITNVFLGEGVEVTNFQFDGDPQAIGFFQNAEDAIGIERGIIMTTGQAVSTNTVPGADGIGNQFASSGATPNIGADADLTALDPQPNNDIARYTISFIPTSDTVRFNYSFASEEYPEFACSSFNDVFGFFISGPGINGPFENNAENIALIPGTDDFVSINNVHPDNGPGCSPVNEQYYNNNNGSNNQPVYDGFTDLFTAEAIVIPCEEYTLKIVIADKGDGAYDSGVFLEAKSFSSPPLDIDIATVSLDGGIVEGCSDAVVTLSLPNPVEADTPIDYEIFGTAENGVDYTEVPLDLFIPQGGTSVSFDLAAFEDNIDEGPEFFQISVQVDPCNRDTFTIPINENQIVPATLPEDTIKCASETIIIDGTLDVELPEPPTFTFSNSTFIEPVGNSICSSVLVSGIEPFTMQPGIIQSVCFTIEHSWVDDLDIFLQAPGGQFIELTTDNGANGDDYINTCFTEDAETVISFPEPFAPASAAPFTGEWQPEGVWSDLYGANSPTNGEWQLCVIDDANGFVGELIEWSITFNPTYRIFYEWTPSEGLSCDDCPNPEFFGTESTGYTMRAYDSYGCEVFDSIHVETIPSLNAPTVVCSEVTEDCITFSWNDVGAPSYEVNVDGTGWIPANGVNEHEVCGLAYLQTVQIEVRTAGVGLCPSFSGFAECVTPACPVPSVVDQSVGNVSCFGGNDGSLNIEMTGTNPPFTFEIDGQSLSDASTANFTTLTAALHDLVITDAADCELTLQVNIEQPEGMNFEDVLIQDVQCNGTADGSATLIVTNGTLPYAFNWSSGETDSVAVALPAGNATVSVTDGNGCELSGSIFISEPEAVEVSLDGMNLFCNGSNEGELSPTVSGGTYPYAYQWNDAAAQTDSTATDLSAGDYTVIVTDANDCTVTANTTITESTPIVTSVSGTEASCNGVTDASATVSASGGGVGVFTYLWDDNAGAQITETATGLDVGLYYVTITDLFNCPVVDSVEITSPNAMEVDFTTTATDCFNTTDGGASLSVTGGTAPFTYTWSDGGANSPDRDDLASGLQTVIVTDDNDCFIEVEIDVPAPAEITVQFTQVDNALCFGGTNGTLTVEASGGSNNFFYTWNHDAALSTATAADLAAGNYCVTVRDDNDCEVTICEDISEPTELTATEQIENTSCFAGSDGQITISPEGGTGPYEYAWNDAGNQDTQTAVGLTEGTYVVIVTDANDCTYTNTYQVTQPTELTAATEFTALSCDGTPDGTATALPDGGTGPYTYTWEGGQSTQTAIDLDAQTYQVTVTDANLCEVVTEITLTEPVAIEINGINSTDNVCFGGSTGSATLDYTGGTAPFNITWSNNETTETIDNLPAGTYTVTISDQSDCVAEESITITEPDDLVIELAQTGSLCNDGTDGTASVVGLAYGNTPADIANFSFAWNSIPNQNTPEATGLNGGNTYTVSITDANNCEWTEEITLDNPDPVEASVTDLRDVSCFEGADGVAQVTGSGGVAPFSYEWSANAGGQTTESAVDLAAGTYTVTVSDANDCTTEVEVSLQEPEELRLSFTSESTSCPGFTDGVVNVTGAGGTMPYNYAWSTGTGGAVRNDLAAGLYTVSIIDGNNCQYNDTVRVDEPQPVTTITEEVLDVSCFGYRDGVIDLLSTGGTPPYTYSLDGQTFVGTSRLIALEPGTYNVTIRDGNDCTYNLSDIEIGEPNELMLDLGEDLRIEYGDSPQIFPTIADSIGGVSFEWSTIGPGELHCYDCSTAVLIDSFPGQTVIELTITDSSGCTDSDLMNIFVNKDVNIQVPTGFSPNGDGQNETLLVHGDSDIEISYFTVYDRWGENLYEYRDFMVNDLTVGWDGTFRGKKMPPGVYVWYIEVIAEDGEPATFKGHTTLLR